MLHDQIPEPVPYSGSKTIPHTELVENDAGLLIQSELNYANSIIHVDDFIHNNHVPNLRKAGELSEDEITEIDRRGLGSRPSADKLSVHEDLLYAKWGKRGLVLDLYIPKKTEGPAPVVLIIHGGGWIQNSHRSYRNFAIKLAKKGYATACAEYRLAGEATYPGGIYDVKAALRWIRANAAIYGLDRDRVGLLGASAGGQLAGLVAFTQNDPRYEGPDNNLDQSSSVKCLVALDGFLNAPVSQIWLNHDTNPQLVNETTSFYRVANELTKTLPSILIVNGKRDLYNWITKNRTDVMIEQMSTLLPHAYELVDGEQETVIGWVDDFLKRAL